MAWPTDTLTQTHTDQDGDNPLLARSELNAAITMLKAILAEASAGSTMWHSGNDGPASGLNADLLDGNEASAFLFLSGIGSVVQGWDENLQQIANMSPYDKHFIVGTGTAWQNRTPANARSDLGLGTSAIRDVGNTTTTVAPGSGSTVYRSSAVNGYQNLGNLTGPISCNWWSGTNAGNYKKAHNSSSNNLVTITINSLPPLHGEELFFELSSASSNPIRIASCGLWSNKALTVLDHNGVTPALYRLIRAPASWPVSTNFLCVGIES